MDSSVIYAQEHPFHALDPVIACHDRTAIPCGSLSRRFHGQWHRFAFCLNIEQYAFGVENHRCFSGVVQTATTAAAMFPRYMRMYDKHMFQRLPFPLDEDSPLVSGCNISSIIQLSGCNGQWFNNRKIPFLETDNQSDKISGHFSIDNSRLFGAADGLASRSNHGMRTLFAVCTTAFREPFHIVRFF